MDMIQFQNISKSYDGVEVLHDISLNVHEGEFITIIGSSGSGKTTLMKMVNGLNVPDTGKIIVKGKDISNEDVVELRRSIGYCIQGSVLFPNMTVEDNIAYVPNIIDSKNMEEHAADVSRLLDIVGLDESLRDHMPDELSGGQRQRVAIARSLAANPSILLMDEPFGAVDEITRNQLQEEILRIHKKTGITILFITHSINEALFLGNRVLVVNEGYINQFGTPEDILNHPETEFVENLVSKEKHILELGKLSK